MFALRLDKEKCCKDAICSRICPLGLIRLGEDGFPCKKESVHMRCIGCGHCVAFCPREALELEDLPMPKAERIAPSALPSPEAVTLFLKNRRSSRFFTEQPVPAETLDKIIEVTGYAPTAKNERQLRWVVVSNPETLEAIKAAIALFFDRYAAIKPATMQQKLGKTLANQWRKGGDPFLLRAKQLAVCIGPEGDWLKTDCAISLAYFELAANALGLGCCWTGFFTRACAYTPELRALLELKEKEEVGGGLIFGYPALRPRRSPPRACPAVHWIK